MEPGKSFTNLTPSKNMKRISYFILFLIFISKPLYCTAQQPGESNKNYVRSVLPRLDSLVQAQISDKSIPSISIGIVKNGEVILAKGYGYADVENSILADETTIYQIGSVTKMFTGHLLSMLVNQGELALSDTLSSFFPSNLSFPTSPSGQEVTIKDIATHSSEFPRYPENLQRIDPDPIKGYSKKEMLRGIELVEINDRVGVRYNYSNFGYGVLGIAMENHAGKDLSLLMKENIFSVYEMKNSSLVFQEYFKEDMAIPYLEVTPYKRTEPWDMEALSGAGNIFSSVENLNNFMIHFMKESPVRQTQTKKHLQINETWSYGLGCFIIDSRSRNTQIIYHGGDIDGYASYMAMYPEYELGITILTNWGEGESIGEAFTAVSEEIVNHFLGPVNTKNQ